MPRKQLSDGASSSKSAKVVNKSRSKNKKSRSGAVNEDNGEPEVLVIPSSYSNSVPVEEKDDTDEVDAEEVNENDEDVEELEVEDDNDDEEEEEGGEGDEVEADAAAKSSKREGSNNKNNKKKEKKPNENCNGASTSSSSLYRFPMHRVSRIMKSEDPGIRISQEAVFIINKASEKFLQLLSTEAYACAFLDRKKYVAYNHLSSAVKKRRRFDFLSDFVPEKLKAEDALKEETPSVDT